MTFLCLALTLLLEQLRPLSRSNPVYALVQAAVDGAQQNLNAGQRRHGTYAWVLLVVVPAAGVAACGWLLGQVSVFAALGFNVAVLYLAMGFRQFSHPVSLIQAALAAGDLVSARQVLTTWKRESEESFNAADLDAAEIARRTVAHGLLLAHRHVFGVFFWFLLLPGATGPVLYRLADYAARRWNRRPSGAEAALPPDRFGEFAALVFAWIDWLPARLTALGFAVVGDFEGALYCWRQVSRRASPQDGRPAPGAALLILAAAGGALGQRLLPPAEAAQFLNEPGLEGAGLEETDAHSLRQAVGLVWRAAVLWMLLLLLVTAAGLLRV